MHLAALMDAEAVVAAGSATGQIDLCPFRPNLPKVGCGLRPKGGSKTEGLAVDRKRVLQSAHLEALVLIESRNGRDLRGLTTKLTRREWRRVTLISPQDATAIPARVQRLVRPMFGYG